MIIISFLVFVFMLVWVIGSVLAAFIGLAGIEAGSGYGLMLGGILSLVCWYQVIVRGKPWFDLLAQAWM